MYKFFKAKNQSVLHNQILQIESRKKKNLKVKTNTKIAKNVNWYLVIIERTSNICLSTQHRYPIPSFFSFFFFLYVVQISIFLIPNFSPTDDSFFQKRILKRFDALKHFIISNKISLFILIIKIALK